LSSVRPRTRIGAQRKCRGRSRLRENPGVRCSQAGSTLGYACWDLFPPRDGEVITTSLRRASFSYLSTTSPPAASPSRTSARAPSESPISGRPLKVSVAELLQLHHARPGLRCLSAARIQRVDRFLAVPVGGGQPSVPHRVADLGQGKLGHTGRPLSLQLSSPAAT